MEDKRTSGEKRGFVVRITAVFVEKILRVQPNVKKLYLLIRAADAKSALQRFNTEAVAKDLFKLLKEKHGTNLQNFLSEKVTPKCVNIKLFLHVSTAYVSGEKPGLMLETPYYLGDSLNGTSGLDIEEERRIVEDKLKELKSDQNADDKSIKLAMIDLGIGGDDCGALERKYTGGHSTSDHYH
ncbi:Fatty acyl-CoA reductase [Cynara cardunculus var. scolymus]|uniref:Fatty acyl-CoA reductase n=1 Tax=Cynara cardunculus var. scolymus TaxID=59895 RepID=A0A103XHA1_CYNCS|nr:Fatty acyl-CoA reductase [Cynara cardunculus var. scolymus]